MTARDLIKGSLRQLGVLADGEQPTASQAQDALSALNDLLDSWSTERLSVYQVGSQQFSLVANKKSYTIGVGGDFNAPYPVRIPKVQLNYAQAGSPNPLNLPVKMIDIDQYQRVTVPDTTAPFPTSVYVDGEFPLRTMMFFPVPSAVNTVEVFSWQALSEFADLDGAVNFPPGYARALKYGLAIEIADEYGTSPSETVVAKAMQSKAAIKSLNIPAPLLRTDGALLAKGGRFNWLTGE